MYIIILRLHSFLRWLVLITLLYAIFRSFTGWMLKKSFSRFDNTVRHGTATVAHIQLILGITLYYISPIVSYFLHHFKDAVHQRQIRFFGMEHSSMMLIAVIMITIGSSKARRQAADCSKFKTIAIWYTIALLIILFSIPWPFSPLISRPYLR